ncbi:hypothetical protein MTO96_013185 [Rhipicephalus appendiculatus]
MLRLFANSGRYECHCSSSAVSMSSKASACIIAFHVIFARPHTEHASSGITARHISPTSRCLPHTSLGKMSSSSLHGAGLFSLSRGHDTQSR